MRSIRLAAFMFLALFIISVRANAQSNTRMPGDTNSDIPRKEATGTEHKMLLIPFAPKMCMSEVGKDVNVKTHLSMDQITEQFRLQLDMAMFRSFYKTCVSVSLLQGRYKSDSVLGYIYESVGYKYDLVPGTQPDAGAADKNKTGKYVHNGQLEVPVDYSKRFMNVNIANPHLLGNLYKKYHTDTFIFINELDIKNIDNQTDNLSDDTYRREIDVQYSIVNKEGKYLAKGMETTYFPFRQNDPKEIGEKYFSVIADQVFKDYAKGLATYNQAEQKKQVRTNNTISPK